MGTVEKKEKEAADGSKDVGLKRNIGLLSAVNIIIGVMIGSGIFISPTAALHYSGSVGMCLIIWALCGIVSLLGALCFAELGTVVQVSGAEYAYLFETFSKMHKFFGPLPAFICNWVYVMVLRPAEVAILILISITYILEPFQHQIGLHQMDESYRQTLKQTLGMAMLFIVTYINLRSTKLFVTINNICSIGKVVACVIVIFGGVYELFKGNTKNLSTGFEGTTSSPGKIALAFFNGLWAYDGWVSVTLVTEEIKDPSKNIPRSILIAVPIITALYVFMNFSYLIVLTPYEMVHSTAVAVDFGTRIFGSFAFLIPLGVALSTFGCALSIQFSVTRLCFVAGREGHFLAPMSYIHHTRLTPGPAVALQGLISMIFLCVGDVNELIEFASFLIWVFYGAAIICLLVLRKTQPDLPRPYKVPLIVPYLILGVSIFLSVTPIFESPKKYIAALCFIISGLVFYIPFVYYRYRPKIMDKFTFLLQVLFEVIPSDKKET